MAQSQNQPLAIIGSTEHIDVASIKNIPAKIDTGADSSSIWASHIRITRDGILKFRLFDEGSPFYTGKAFKRTDYKVAIIRDASGREHIRYRTHITMRLKEKRIRALFSLSDRSKNNFPVLIGRRTIAGKFLVDVSKHHTTIPPKNPKTKLIACHLKENPYEFHCKYIKKLGGNPDSIKLKERS